eukprot:CAMPEP_0204600594 /NCGR_PEP_ID=MMETSP0661-20131031/55530_1 /ASSEMBLY_ACC=CAM_ASM_000606 /TAXON_ID=109239 /ORGANISM="Alexandrium margalefi, Strain AMGDE01CS-322" /LENGTH=77 /DNA_ID=CAMNT_0051611411 /DNA_START=178 /DNA_END=411 /DNA_ORIENTATION=+
MALALVAFLVAVRGAPAPRGGQPVVEDAAGGAGAADLPDVRLHLIPPVSGHGLAPQLVGVVVAAVAEVAEGVLAAAG